MNAVALEPHTDFSLTPEGLHLRPFQRDGVAFLVLHPDDPRFPIKLEDNPWGVAIGQFHKLLADDMGLGKTVQVVAALNCIDAKNVVVICPATVKIHWARTLVKWSTKKLNVFVVSHGRAEIPANADIIIVNYELLLRPKIYRQIENRGINLGYDAVVMDESHYLKSMDAQRTKRILGTKSFLQYAQYKWALTGTPLLNRPSEMYPILYTLAPETIAPYTSWRAFGEYFCRGHMDRKCRKCAAFFDYDDVQCPRCKGKSVQEYGFNARGASNVVELSQRIKPFMLRRKLEDVEAQLPPKVETVIELNVLPPSSLDDTHIATARRELAMAKIPEATKFISDMLQEVSKVVVFAHHRNVLETLRDSLDEFGAVLCYGGMDINQKQTAIDNFRTDETSTRVFCAQTVAGGTGVDGLQDVSNHVVFIELDWSPGIMDQAIARVRRMGQTAETVFVYYLAVPNSIDTLMAEVISNKRDVINRIIKSEEVTKMTLIPEVQVAMAQALNAVAVSLQTIASVLKALEASSNGAQTVEVTAPEKPVTKAPPKGKAKPTTPDPEVVKPGAPAPPANELTVGDLIKQAGVFIAKFPTRDAGVTVVNEQIWPKYEADALKNLDPVHYAAAFADLQKEPSDYELVGDSLDI